MSEAHELLGRIGALKRRLEQAQGLINEAGHAAVHLIHEEATGLSRLWGLERDAQDQSRSIDHQRWRYQHEQGRGPSEPLPQQLTQRARRVLERGRELLAEAKTLADEPLIQQKENPLSLLYREITRLLDTTVRMVQLFPNTVSGQLKLCEGMEVTINDVCLRLEKLKVLVYHQQRIDDRVKHLANLLLEVEQGELKECKPFSLLAEQIMLEAESCSPFHIFHPTWTESPSREWVADCVARHSLVVAQVIARLLRLDNDLRHRSTEVIAAALLHDIGMLRVDPTILAKTEKLNAEERRAIEKHPLEGEDILKAFLSPSNDILDAVRHHHERLSGIGYPEGEREFQLTSLSRLLAVCDVYAACCATRPHRNAYETRTALTETLLMAEQGVLDRKHAQRLLHISFYPVGSIVELADGACGAVLATPTGRSELTAPARPVIALLTDTERHLLPVMEPIDLVQCESRSIVRTLTKAERVRLLGSRYPEWV